MRTYLSAILCGLTACFGMSASVRAFEAPSPAASAQSVQTCSGQGYFYIPGLDACLQAGARDQSWPAESAAARTDNVWGPLDLGIDSPTPAEMAGSAALPADEAGWQVQGGLQFGLPGTESRAQGWIQGSYAEGAVAGSLGKDSSDSNVWNGAVLDPALFASQTGDDRAAELGAGFDVQASGTLRLGVGAGYSAESLDGVSAEAFSVGSSLLWTPIENLDLGLSALYRERLSGAGSDALSVKARLDRDF